MDLSSPHNIHKSLFDDIEDLPEAYKNIIHAIMTYYNGIIAAMPGNVYWLDSDCKTVGCNSNVLNMFGMTNPEEFFGLTFEDMEKIGKWNKNQAKSFKHDTLEVIQTGIAISNREEPPIPGIDGKETHFLTTREPIKDKNNKTIGIVGISTDITNQKTQERELKKAKLAAEIANKRKTEFLSNMRHDLRTPISNVVSLSETLDEICTDPNLSSIIHDIKISSLQLYSVIDDLLNLSEFSVEDIVLNHQEFGFIELIEAITQLVKVSLDKKPSVKLITDIDATIPKRLNGSLQSYRIIIMNLLDNAIKFTQEGSITIRIKLISETAKYVSILIEIIDTGIGIEASQYEHVFGKFERLHPSYQEKYPGSGLGLYFVKKFANALNAEVTIKSKPNHGSTFSLEAKLLKVSTSALSKQDPQQQIVTSSPAAMPCNETPNILIVEDNLITQRAMQILFEHLGCYIEIVTNGTAAISYLEKNRYDLVFLDIGLPDMSGFDICEIHREKERRNNTPPTPIIVLTAHASKEDKQRCILAGAQQVLTKPLHIETARQIIMNWIHHQ